MDFENCRITRYPAPVLAGSAKNVEKIDDDIRKLVDIMTDIMVEYNGIGLAAPQAGVPLRLFIVSLDATRENVKAYINPTVTPTGQNITNEEGCLSVPGVFTKVSRSETCTVTATDLDGNEFTEDAQGLLARCLQHEYDHIQGMTIVNHMGQTAKIMHRRKLKELVKEYEENA